MLLGQTLSMKSKRNDTLLTGEIHFFSKEIIVLTQTKGEEVIYQCANLNEFKDYHISSSKSPS